jgi:hypothetical protein
MALTMIGFEPIIFCNNTDASTEVFAENILKLNWMVEGIFIIVLERLINSYEYILQLSLSNDSH